MPIVLFRVDERLIHGQVVVDDALAASPWEQELYCLGLPPEIEASFLTLEQARGALPGWKQDTRRTVVLVRDVDTAGRMAAEGLLTGEEVNLGGIHHAEGRRQVLPYLHLRPAEQAELEQIAALGASVAARDLPASRRVPLDELAGG
jgi:PTS system mannose-specific IIB component/fructoselysine and glucoselysine-specific PTS system IIB component